MQLRLYILSMIAIDYRVNIKDEKSLLQVLRFYLNYFSCYLSNISLLQFGNDRIYIFYFQVITCAFTLNIWYPKGVSVIAFYVRKQKDLEALNVCVISQYTALRHHINFSVNSKDKRLVEV